MIVQYSIFDQIFWLPSVFVAYLFVLIFSRITVYLVTVPVSGYTAPSPVSVKNMVTEMGEGFSNRFRSFSSLHV